MRGLGRRRKLDPVARSSGFSLIEVLIAILVLSVGLLGFALTQTMTLRFTQSSDYRTRATNLAYELLDQMRVNRLSVVDYTNATFDSGDVGGGDCGRAIGQEVPITGDGGVVKRWQCQVVEALGPSASATVTYNAGSGLATVVLAWGDRIEADSSTSFEVETYL